jgi:hypothetical protein
MAAAHVEAIEVNTIHVAEPVTYHVGTGCAGPQKDYHDHCTRDNGPQVNQQGEEPGFRFNNYA